MASESCLFAWFCLDGVRLHCFQRSRWLLLLSPSPPLPQMVVMPGPCGHSMCKDCFRGYFEITIREKSVKHFNCPECGQPDIGDLGEIKDFYLELFVALVSKPRRLSASRVRVWAVDVLSVVRSLSDKNISERELFLVCCSYSVLDNLCVVLFQACFGQQ